MSVRGEPAPAVEALDAALAEHPLSALPPLDRPYALLAAAYARAGRPKRARALLAEYEAAVTPESRRFPVSAWLYRTARGEAALAEGRPAEAVEELRPRVRASQKRLEEIVAERG
ncbi:MAG: hypothetical protein ACE5HQ_06280 [Gemmatimonadota bacterium]